MTQHIKQMRVRQPDGSVVYEDVADVEGMITIALSAKMAGQGSPRIDALLTWVAGLGRVPTDAEFRAWVAARGVVFVDMTVENHEN